MPRIPTALLAALWFCLFAAFASSGIPAPRAEADSLRELGDSLRLGGSPARALAAYGLAADEYRRLEARAALAMVYRSLGQALQDLSEHEAALDCYRTCLRISRELGDRSLEGRALLGLGAVHGSRSEASAARARLVECLALARESGDGELEARALNNLGLVRLGQSSFSRALDDFKLALRIAEEREDLRSAGRILNNIGLVHLDLAEYQRALECFANALKSLRRSGDRWMEGRTLSNLGIARQSLGDHHRALERFAQSLELVRETGDRQMEGRALSNMATIFQGLAETELAEEYYTRSLDLFEQVGDRSMQGAVLLLLGSLQLDSGDHARALKSAGGSLKIAREVGDRMAEGRALSLLVGVHLELEQHLRARRCGELAETIAEELGADELRISAQAALGDLHSVAGRDSLAAACYARAVECADRIIGRLDLESHRIGYRSGIRHIQRRLIATELRLGRKDRAFAAQEALRARALLEILESGPAGFSRALSDDDALKERALKARCRRLNRRIAEAGGSSGDAADTLRALRRKARAELEAFRERLYYKYPGARDLRGRAGPIGLRGAQRLLARDEAALSYLVLEDRTLLFVLRRDRLEVLDCGTPAAAVGKYVDRLRRDPRHGAPGERGEAVDMLSEALIAPALPCFDGVRRLCILPDGEMHYLPFQALRNPASGRFLIEDFAVYTVPSFSTLSWLRQMGTFGKRKLLAYGDPDCAGGKSVDSGGRRSLPALPESREEVLALGRVYGPLATVRTGLQAGEGSFTTEAAGYGVIHLAAHALLNEHGPLYSSIALSPDEEHDGFLEAWEIMRLKLNADIVVLSACETALGEMQQGEGLLGLSRAFFSAGAPSVVASLWKVEDRPTKLLMERFHEQLRDGQRPADALRTAQLHLLRETRYVHPRYWAPFVLIGDSE